MVGTWSVGLRLEVWGDNRQDEKGKELRGKEGNDKGMTAFCGCIFAIKMAIGTRFFILIVS